MKTTVQRLPASAKSRCFNPYDVCLNKGRFRANVSWRDFQDSGRAVPVATSSDSGMFYFFNADNTEMLVKVLDACGLASFNSYWVFAAAATNVEYTLTVTDTQTGQTRTYDNPLGMNAPAITDTGAFATCP